MRKCWMLAIVCLCFASMAFAQEKPLVDKYGQSLNETWAGKITTDAQLQADAAKEAAQLARAQTALPGCDRYGGVKEGKPLPASGYFRLAKIGGRWWLITPEGNRFFMQGVDAVSYLENGYFTPLFNPDGTARGVFQELPDRTAFPEAYLGKRVNFLAANIQRKYGSDYARRWRETTFKRLRSWGFNSTGQWGWGFTLGLPYVEDMNFTGLRRIDTGRGVMEIDPFDPAFPAQVARGLTKLRPECKNDPFLIGYALENEDGWSLRTVTALLKLDGSSPAKRAFLNFLLKRHGDSVEAVAALFNRPGASLDGLLNESLPLTDALTDDGKAFLTFASETYHAVLAKALKEYDPHHLFLGGAHCGAQSIEWIAGSAQYVDAIILHDYSLHADWITEHLDVYNKLDKPLLILEFSFVVEGRGMRLYNPSNTLSTEKERGQAYRLYTERLAANPLTAGFGWFIYYDQPVTMRSLPNGESFNFGLVNGCDQPYYQAIAEMKKSNARLYAIHKGAVAPVRPKDVGLGELLYPFGEMLKGSTDPALKRDSGNPHYFAGERSRLKLDETVRPTPGVHCGGVWDAGKGKVFTGAQLTCYLWKKLAQTPAAWFGLEQSADNRHFTPVALAFTPGVPGEFNQYLAQPKQGLKPDTRYLRFTLTVNQSDQSWVNQLGKVRLDAQRRR